MPANAGSPVGRSGKRAMHFRAECPLDRGQDIDLTEDDLCVFRIGGEALVSVIGTAAGFRAAPKRAAAEGLAARRHAIGARSVSCGGACSSDRRRARRIVAPGGAGLGRHDPRTAVASGDRPETPRYGLSSGRNPRGADACHGWPRRRNRRRGSGAGPPAPVLRVGRATAEVHWDGRSVILSRQIFPVFERLLEKALSRDQVASGSHVEGTTAREAKDLIRELRDAFKAAGFTDAESKTLIVTVRNRGYRIGVPAAEILVDG